MPSSPKKKKAHPRKKILVPKNRTAWKKLQESVERIETTSGYAVERIAEEDIIISRVAWRDPKTHRLTKFKKNKYLAYEVYYKKKVFDKQSGQMKWKEFRSQRHSSLEFRTYKSEMTKEKILRRVYRNIKQRAEPIEVVTEQGLIKIRYFKKTQSITYEVETEEPEFAGWMHGAL